jgi:ABC-type oligopeptide transport system substrate-binding subunit
MKTIGLALILAGILTACGGKRESSAGADGTANINSTTPPPTSDSTNPVGVMMSDTSTAVADSLNRQK